MCSNNYVRVSLSGGYEALRFGSVTIFRDLNNLGNAIGGLAIGSFSGYQHSGVGIVLADSPGDTSTHTYQVYINTNASSNNMSFPFDTVGYLLLEEVSQ